MSALQIAADAPAIVHAAGAVALALHIGGGTAGMISGGVAMFAPKGGRLHRVAGTVFVVSMLTMTGIATVVAPMLPEDRWTNTTAAVFTLYLVASAWMTVRRRGEVGRFERIAVTIPLGIALMGLVLAVTRIPAGQGEGFTTVFAFAVICALAAACDLAMIHRGAIAGANRMARHVWRMSAGLFVATGSFFFGQPDVQPQWLRDSAIPMVLGLAPLVLMVFWLLKVRFARLFRFAPAAA
ncbi:MAG: hypothetical protein ABW360_13405 [Phenylobacterium sp.]